VSHLAQRAGYHPVFLGNNSFLIDTPFFARLTNRGSPQTGTIDTIAALPALFARYADERVFLVYYLSTPHGFSSTPRRLAERLGCASLSGMEAERCLYEARVAHADEAVEALQRGLAASGLTGRTLQVLAADHGEVFGDGRPVETRLFDRWWSLDQGHGGATHWNEIHVPLVLAGPGVEPGVWSGRVSTLDVLPTLASLMRLDPPQKLDGQALPPFGPARAEAHRFVTQGYCSHSVLEGWTQLVWWEAECAERRELGSGRQLTHRAELWERGALVATDESDPARVAGPLREHLEWLAARLPGEAWLVDASGIAPARLRVKALEGFITDYGPGDGPASLGSFKATLRDDGRELLLEFDRAPGPVVVATWPPAARVRFDVEPFGAQAFVGRLQLPLALLARAVDPSQRPDLWLAAAEPARPVASGRHLRIWRQAYRKEQKAGPRSVTELDRVLREWGYIR
jgi:hypothetical protein